MATAMLAEPTVQASLIPSLEAGVPDEGLSASPVFLNGNRGETGKVEKMIPPCTDHLGKGFEI